MSSKRIFGIISKKEAQIPNVEPNIYKISEENGLKIDFCKKTATECIVSMSISGKYSAYNHESTGVIIDGEIANAEELKVEFEIPGDSDEELVLHLWKNKKNIEELLIGSFCIVLFDLINKVFFIVRDSYGMKPLFYVENKDFFAFSSEIKFLNCIKLFGKKPNTKRLLQYMCQYKPSVKETFYKNIFLLEPSKYLLFKDGFLRSSHYKHYKEYGFQGKDLTDAKKALRQRLTEACKVKKNESFSVQLSGGLDSAIIYKIIKKLRNESVKSVSFNFFENNGAKLECDEKFFQEIIHKNSGEHESISFTDQSPYDHIDKWLERFDEPYNLANSYLFEELHKYAKKNSISTVIDGVDGDTVISHGWERFDELFKIKSIFTFFKELKLFSNLHNYDEYRTLPLFRMFLVPLLRKKLIFKPLFAIKDFFLPLPKPKRIIKESILEEIGFVEQYDFSRNFRPHLEKINNPLIGTAFINIDILFFKYDVKLHHPFFDKRVVDLCTSLPSEMKLKNGISRYILRESFKDEIPKEIYNRHSKANLTLNFLEKINKKDLKMIQNEINNPHSHIKKYIDQEILENEFEILKTKKMSERTSMNIWNYVLTNRWLKANF